MYGCEKSKATGNGKFLFIKAGVRGEGSVLGT
jgi:hypothetical protein